MIKLYGVPQSRAFRNMWMLGELGLPYENVKIGFVDGKVVDPQLRRVNPNNKLPALVDGDTVLFESLAINLYLAEKAGGSLKGANAAETGRIAQWTLWAATEIEMALRDWAFNAIVYPPEKRDAAVAEAGRARIEIAAAVLEAALAGRQWLAADRFTVADLNVAVVCLWLPRFPDIGNFPNVVAWMERCWARPAAIAARKLREG